MIAERRSRLAGGNERGVRPAAGSQSTRIREAGTLPAPGSAGGLTGVSLDARPPAGCIFRPSRNEDSDIGWMRLPPLAADRGDAGVVAGLVTCLIEKGFACDLGKISGQPRRDFLRLGTRRRTSMAKSNSRNWPCNSKTSGSIGARRRTSWDKTRPSVAGHWPRSAARPASASATAMARSGWCCAAARSSTAAKAGCC